MDFFLPQDFEYFSRVIGKKIIGKSPEANSIKSFLVEKSVYAKTNHWAKHFEKLGFKVEMSWHWQHSGIIRSYTWAKIFLPGDEEADVFFTVGVGSRFTVNNERVNTLEFKLDCQRDRLAPSQIHAFDSYLQENCPKAQRQVIENDSIDGLNWATLINETHVFIEEHLEHYKKVIKVVWPHNVGVEHKLARLCWNTRDWKSPSGEIGKSKSTADPFEKNKGYGYEEWLFNDERQIDGFNYGFIQVFHKGKHHGKTYNVALYSINYDQRGNKSTYYWVGNIKELIVLTKVEQLNIRETYKERGGLMTCYLTYKR